MASVLTARVARNFSSSAKTLKNVAVLGAAGGIGQPLSLLLKNSDLVTNLHVYDLFNVPGVAADLSHVSTPAKIKAFETVDEAVKGVDVIVIPAGMPRKEGMTRDDLFAANAKVAADLAVAIAKNAPKAHVLVITNPVNSTVPIMAEIFKKHNVYNPKHLYGVTHLDVTRAKTFVSELKNVSVKQINIPVIGGHAGTTILPLLSQNNLNLTFTDKEAAELTHRIQFGGDEVVKAKAGKGSATLSMAFAGAEFTFSLIKALNGASGITEYAYVDSKITKAPFFSSKLTLGKDGIETVHAVGKINASEEKALEALVPELVSSAAKGVEFVKKNY